MDQVWSEVQYWSHGGDIFPNINPEFTSGLCALLSSSRGLIILGGTVLMGPRVAKVMSRAMLGAAMGRGRVGLAEISAEAGDYGGGFTMAG